MRIFMTGGSGVIGHHTIPMLTEAGHEVDAPGSADLDLFDPDAVRDAVETADAILHCATRIPPPELRSDPKSWVENDRLRGQATPILVRAGQVGSAQLFLMPTVTFVYPPGPADETTPVRDDLPYFLKSAMVAEQAVAAFTDSGRRGIVLRLGLLYGPGTGSDDPDTTFGTTLQIEDAARAMVAALDAPAGTYNVVADGEEVSNELFRRTTGWAPTV